MRSLWTSNCLKISPAGLETGTLNCCPTQVPQSTGMETEAKVAPLILALSVLRNNKESYGTLILCT